MLARLGQYTGANLAVISLKLIAAQGAAVDLNLPNLLPQLCDEIPCLEDTEFHRQIDRHGQLLEIVIAFNLAGSHAAAMGCTLLDVK